MRQKGIYYQHGETPGRCYSVVFLNIHNNAKDDNVIVHPTTISKQISSLFGIYENIRQGKSRDLRDVISKREKDLTFLIGYGKGLYGKIGKDRLIPLIFKTFPEFNYPPKKRVWDTSGLPYAPTANKKNINAHLAIQFISNTESSSKQAVLETWKFIHDQKTNGGVKIADYRGLDISGYYTGFHRNDARNMMDFLDGVSNVKPTERKKVIFTNKDTNIKGDEKQWINDSTYMCFMRISINFPIWRSIPIAMQRAIVGRDKNTGCPVRSGKAANRIKECPTNGTKDILHGNNKDFREYSTTDLQFKRSHVGRVRDSNNTEVRIFRQGYNFFDISNVYPYFSSGLNFVSFQRDPKHIQTILTSEKWMGGISFGGEKERQDEHNLKKLISVESAGMFFVPRLNKNNEDFPGQGIFL